MIDLFLGLSSFCLLLKTSATVIVHSCVAVLASVFGEGVEVAEKKYKIK